MDALLDSLLGLSEVELYRLSEAVDLELQKREEDGAGMSDPIRRLVDERLQDFRRRTSLQAPAARVIELDKVRRRPRAA